MADYEEEMESFGMENDFEDGDWIGGELYCRKRKDKRRLQTKDDAILGVFAGTDSDNSSSKKRKKSDLATSLSFVSAGTVVPNIELDKISQEQLNESDLVDDQPKLTGLGLGFRSDSRKETDNHGDESDGGFLPSAFGRKIKEGVQQRRERERERAKLANVSESESSGMREVGCGGGDVGSFEKHTKGIGMKLLENMGYKGGGLGKYEQGIVNPIEATKRRNKMGIGFDHLKELLEERELLHGVVSQPAAAAASSSYEKLWSKQARTKKKKKRDKDYITAEELLAGKQEQGLEVVQKVFDMRGPQVRVLTNLENLNGEEKARENSIPMPELHHNVRLVVDLAELDIQKFDNDLRKERETLVTLRKEMERLQHEAAHGKKQLDTVVGIVCLVDQIGEENFLGTLTLDSLGKSFRVLQGRYAGDYKLCNLSCIACAFALPLLDRVFQGWDPLQSPSHGVNEMSLWKNLLEGENSFDFPYTASLYTQLFMEVVFPAARLSATNTWQVRDPEPILNFLESWEKLLPPSALETILDKVVMPKLSAAVDSWDPHRVTITIHQWVHPWLPLLGQKLEPLYHTIRNRLEGFLRDWNPRDMAVYDMLSPWKTVFDPASWEQLMVRFVIPKLLAVMHESQVNPGDQNPDQFNLVKTWATVIPIHHAIHLMDVFFDKWQQVLYHWLCSNPNFDEVKNWYLDWKKMLPPELLANEHVRYRLSLALDMMNEAVEGREVVQPGSRERKFEAQQNAAAHSRASVSLGSAIQMEGMGGGTEMSLKEVIEKYAQMKGLLYMPKPGRMHDGHQIYRFGEISITIDSLNEMVFALTENRWSLVSLKRLLEMQSSSGLKWC
ncbi:hypothetical protein RHGRI_008868 [Rhododendron griersonianum]|uniref:G-patch domain-containing protein n=1 Tax=Rhododendron griersonianum TaxID=479676 RepID=A0AAV6L1X7_9ERIC|nr:hypothetical protein RHGRI_008868 [Rhododendron griersonianum]